MVNNIRLIQIPVHAKFILNNDFGILEHLLLGGSNSLKYKERHFQSAVKDCMILSYNRELLD